MDLVGFGHLYYSKCKLYRTHLATHCKMASSSTIDTIHFSDEIIPRCAVHSLPFNIQHSGAAATKTFFNPEYVKGAYIII